MAGADGLQAVVQWRFAHASRGFVLAVGKVGRVEQAETFANPFAQVVAVALEGLVAAHIDFPQVGRWMSAANPFRNDLADAAGGLQADGIQPRRDEAIPALRRLANVVAHIRREAFGSAEELGQPGAAQGRHPVHRLFQHRREMVQTAGNLVETKVLGNAIDGPGAGIGLEGANQQFAGVVFEIGASVVVADHRQIGAQSVHLVKQRVIMLAGVQGHVHADRRRQLPGPHAGAQDQGFGANFAVPGCHAGDAAAFGQYGADGRVLENARAGGDGCLCQGVGDINGVGIAVGGDMNAADHILNLAQRQPGPDGRAVEHVHFQPENLGHRRAALELFKALFVAGQRDRAAAPVARRLAGFRFQARIQCAGVARQRGHIDRIAQLPHQPRGVPGRAAG